MTHEKKEVDPVLPVGVNKGIKQIADWDGHQGEHKHPCSCWRGHVALRVRKILCKNWEIEIAQPQIKFACSQQIMFEVVGRKSEWV